MTKKYPKSLFVVCLAAMTKAVTITEAADDRDTAVKTALAQVEHALPQLNEQIMSRGGWRIVSVHEIPVEEIKLIFGLQDKIKKEIKAKEPTKDELMFRIIEGSDTALFEKYKHIFNENELRYIQDNVKKYDI